MTALTVIASAVITAEDDACVSFGPDQLADVLGDAIHDAGYRLVPLADLPSEAHARRTDGAESWDAARSIEDLNARQHAVFVCLESYGAGMTDECMADRYRGLFDRPGSQWPGQTPASLRTRRAELVAAGLVRATGETRPTRSGRQAQVWEACGA